MCFRLIVTFSEAVFQVCQVGQLHYWAAAILHRLVSSLKEPGAETSALRICCVAYLWAVSLPWPLLMAPIHSRGHLSTQYALFVTNAEIKRGGKCFWTILIKYLIRSYCKLWMKRSLVNGGSAPALMGPVGVFNPPGLKTSSKKIQNGLNSEN